MAGWQGIIRDSNHTIMLAPHGAGGGGMKKETVATAGGGGCIEHSLVYRRDGGRDSLGWSRDE